MTTRMEQPSRGRAPRVVSFAMFVLLALCLPGATSAQWATSGTNISNTNTGNVGVGTPTPSAPLHVFRDFGNGNSGTVAVVGGKPFWSVNDYERLRVGFTQFDSIYDAFGGWAMGFRTGASDGSGVERLRITSGGNVGIGTSAPSARLQVSGAGAYANPGGAEFRLHNTAWNGSFTQHLGDTGTWQLADATTGATKIAVNPGLNGAINLFNGAGNVVVNGTGNVGVGTAAPASKLHVAGDIRVDGNINAKYQDVAEWVPTTQKLSAGTVVILNPERPNHVLASTASYDTAVAGVISEKPGLSLGEAGEGRALVATTGRVKVKVDATRAPIKVGDLLVTSDTLGVAMRSQPLDLGGVPIHRPGTIIGKALEPLLGGKGEILVLLSLQ